MIRNFKYKMKRDKIQKVEAALDKALEQQKLARKERHGVGAITGHGVSILDNLETLRCLGR